MKKFCLLLSLVLVFTSCSVEKPLSTQLDLENTTVSAKKRNKGFRDNFEKDQGWGVFEEIVGGSSCYGDGIASVERSTDFPFRQDYSLLVWANKGNSNGPSLKSNHLLANKKLADEGRVGQWRYSMWAYVPTNDPSVGRAGEAGPEFSMQNTRELSAGTFRTMTAGIQYRANPYATEGQWAIWTEKEPGSSIAEWKVFTMKKLSVGTWYKLVLDVDYDTNRYIKLEIRGGKGEDKIRESIDLSGYSIAQEVKFTEAAFWLTLESENLYNNCGTAGAFDYQVYYDNVRLRPLN